MAIVSHILSPIFDANSRILILGTMPSPRSREVGFYYGHPRNRFWRIMAALYGTTPLTENAQRRMFLLEHHIALWDVLASCEINGADDGSIRAPVPNPIETLLPQTAVRTIFTTGGKAAQLYRRLILPKTHLEAIALPSTSPANCRNCTFETLLAAYQILLDYTK